MSTPLFWSTPIRYLRWASHEKPAIFYSLLIGSMGPVALVTLPPLRRALGDVDPEPIPLSYPRKDIIPSEGRESVWLMTMFNLCSSEGSAGYSHGI
jgi:hypothetical protein